MKFAVAGYLTLAFVLVGYPTPSRLASTHGWRNHDFKGAVKASQNAPSLVAVVMDNPSTTLVLNGTKNDETPNDTPLQQRSVLAAALPILLNVAKAHFQDKANRQH
ncbi:hypothetical protein FOCC_FOCC014108 [Frankliniella occidentalis]|uniref:Uncharacterized protein LOC113207629 n=1 Tax=Frankliniella occidentalis TaxID=133901 RepID=A0A6J1SNB9_FRAOC|nr:uncharacterized protein LOC113207629 [Frankliniella occidentalis]KAE8740372.1 hypothetical protein FOCC_FOCC014108 [Frankliniella occidentalis]